MSIPAPHPRRLVALVLALALIAATSHAAALDGCKRCDGAGVVLCKTCAKDACSDDPLLLFCSARLACEDCGGVGFEDCPRCDPEEDALAARTKTAAAGRAWLAKQREIDAFMRHEGLLHAESEHFVLTFDIRRISIGEPRPKAVTPHAAMHAYLQRLEDLFAAFCEDVSANPKKDFFGKTRVMLWDSADEQERASTEYTRQPSTTQSKLMGANPVVSIHYDKSHLHEEFELHQAVVHQVTHCLLSNVFDGIWTGNINGGWIDAGLAHYYEVEQFDGVRHYCYVETDTMRRFKFGQWEPAVRKGVDGGDSLPFLQVAGKHTTELEPEEHMYAWSFVHYVLAKHPGKFGALARALKQKKPLKDALEEALDLNPFEFEANWKAFVQAEYSLKPKR